MVAFKNSYNIGKIAEQKAKVFIENKGYKVLCTNYKTKYGEIDILAVLNNTIVAFEVKAHKQNIEYSISQNQKKRIIDALMFFLSINSNFLNHQIRFDAILIKLNSIRHLESAWGEDF